MIIEILGYKIRVELIIAGLIIYFILSSCMLCSCSKVSLQEGLSNLGTELNYKMGEGVSTSWDTKEMKEGSSLNWREQNHDAYDSEMVDPNKQMDFLANTEFSPKCCGSSYSGFGGLQSDGGSSGGGCACLNKQQINYLNTRGGNRTLPSEY